MKIWILFLILIPITSAVNISVEYPNSICSGEEFSVSIDIVNSSNVYDFKIDLFGNGFRVSRIWNDGSWKSTMYYTTGSKNFRLIVPEYIGDIDMEIKLRNNDVLVFSGYMLTSSACTEEMPVARRSLPVAKEDDKEEEVIGIPKEEKIKEFEIKRVEVKKLEPIILTPQTIKMENNSEVLSKGYRKYSIIVFCIVLLILYIKNARKKKNEFI